MKKEITLLILLLAGSLLYSENAHHLLSIESDAEGAVAYLDGQMAGLLPWEETLTEGSHSLRISADGFYDYSTSFTLEKQLTLQISMEEIRYRLQVSADIDEAAVFLDGQFAGIAPIELTASPGEHLLKVTKPGYCDYTRSIEVEADGYIEAKMNTRLVQIFVQIPYAYRTGDSRPHFFIDEIPQDSLEVEVSPGTHRIRLESDSLKMEAEYDFIAGGSYRITPFMQLRITQ